MPSYEQILMAVKEQERREREQSDSKISSEFATHQVTDAQYEPVSTDAAFDDAKPNEESVPKNEDVINEIDKNDIPEVENNSENASDMHVTQEVSDDVVTDKTVSQKQAKLSDDSKIVDEQAGQSEYESKESKRGRPSQKSQRDTSRVDLPSSLVKMANSQIGVACNNSDAVAAWMYAKSDKIADVPDEIKQLSKYYIGDQMSNQLSSIDETLISMNNRLLKLWQNFDKASYEHMYMLAYIMLDIMGELKSTNIDFMDMSQPIYETLIDRMRHQVNNQRNHEALKRRKMIE